MVAPGLEGPMMVERSDDPSSEFSGEMMVRDKRFA